MKGPSQSPQDNIKQLISRIEPAVKLMDMTLDELSPGYARVSLIVKAEHLNFHNMAFGGIIVSIADHALGYAANSLAYPSVASQFNIHFLQGATLGDRLTAEANVIKSGRKISVSEVKIYNDRKNLIAIATGTTVPVKGDVNQ